MNKKAFAAAAIVLGLIGLFAVGFYAVVYSIKAFEESVNSNHKEQIVAKNVQITDEWTEITPIQLLESTNQFQAILLSTECFNETEINPEIEIIDENGKVYRLKGGSRLNSHFKFSLDEKLHGFDSFPRDVKYRTIRIRSDKTFKCEKIIWYDYTLK
jgi:hypothetical protein